nr:VWA domain-containing protein [Frankia sp. BMG5.23]
MVSFPLSAVVGMDDLRLALLLNAVSPTLGGILVRGEKGTAKSTAVRGLAALLPPVTVTEGCRFSCAPDAPLPDCPDGPHPAPSPSLTRPARLVELPVGASEDRLTGSLDLDRALADGVSVLRPGLLAAAHRGLLYVDEVNLLGDHLVDLLLDAAAFGVAHVERDGVSVRHPAVFLLVGTMNPEEGELRPQLLDRFGLTVHVAASRDPAVRAEVVRRRLAFEADPAGFAATWADAEAELAARVVAARGRLGTVRLTDAALRAVTAICAGCDVDGMRADVVLAKTAMALAAWAGRATVLAADIRTGARLALPHRRRRGPFDAPGMDDETLDAVLDEALAALDERVGAEREAGECEAGEEAGEEAGGSGAGESGAGESGVPVNDARPDDDPPDGGGSGGAPRGDGGSHGCDGAGDGNRGAGNGGDDGKGGDSGDGGDGGDRWSARPSPSASSTASASSTRLAGASAAASRPRLLTVAGLGTSSGATGRRSPARGSRGALVTTAADAPGLHLPATLLAAAPFQAARGRCGPGLVLVPADRRGAVRVGREGNLVLFVVDASGSMAARARMTLVTTAVLALLVDAYQRRDRIGMITFRGSGAEVVLAPTSSVEVGAARLRALPTGGRTPLAAGLGLAGEVLRAERRRDPTRRALLVVVTDGRATAGDDPLPVARALVRAAGGAAGPATGGRAGTGGRGGGGRGGGRGELSSVVVDCENGFLRLGLAQRLAGALGGVTIPLDSLHHLTPRATPRATSGKVAC